MIPAAGSLIGLVGWGVVVGVDFITVPQGLLSRPLVAAAGAGLILGNAPAGLLAGIMLELYALDVLPIGASWYPDYGIAAVAGGAAAALGPRELAPGLAGLVALPMAVLGGWTLLLLRRRNAISVGRRLERIAGGDGQVLGELQRNGVLRDALRSLLVAVTGLVFAGVVLEIPWDKVAHAELLSLAAIGGGLAAAIGGALRNAGTGQRRRWLGVGLALGGIVALLQ